MKQVTNLQEYYELKISKYRTNILDFNDLGDLEAMRYYLELFKRTNKKLNKLKRLDNATKAA